MMHIYRVVFVNLDDLRDFFDISAVNQEDVLVVAEYAKEIPADTKVIPITEEMMTSTKFCPK